jgi:ATP-binding cassette subfamily F protein 3
VPLASLDQVSIAYGHLPLLDAISLQVEPKERVALIGRNGTGKSTLLQIVAGDVQPDAGTVWREPGLKIARLEQDVPLSSNRTVFDVVADGHTQHGADDEAWVREHHVDLVLSRLNLSGDAVVDTLSGGWRRRVLLARALVGQPDLLLLDEPTNHLDIEALEWLEQTLTSLDAAIVLVAHDRWFLEAVATSVLELERGRGRYFPGPWHAWRKEKATRELARTRAGERQQAEIERLERFVNRFRAGTRSRQAKSRARKLEKMERLPAASRSRKDLKFEFAPAARSGRVVFELSNGRILAGDRVLLDGAELWLERGEHVSLVGRNGAGKTTLIELLAGRRGFDPDSPERGNGAPTIEGKLRAGHNVKLGFLPQHDEFEQGTARTVLEATQRATGLTPARARALLGRFLFSGADAEKPLEGLSGGERRRLSLAMLVGSGANVLLLDEPTNHLDLESREALEDALRAFAGAVLIVSHDRALLDAVGTRTIAFEGARLRSYDGGWAEYVRARRGQAVGAGG